MLNNNDPNALPTQTAFSQQRIDAWRPLLTPKIVVFVLFIIGTIFTGCGVLFYFMMKNAQEVSVRYDELVEGKPWALVPITLEKDMKGNTWLFYKLTNFFQNHRRYIYSRSDSQLRGEYVEYDDMPTDLEGFISVNNSKDPADMYLPSGAIALSFFNDTYTFYNNTAGATVTAFDAGISWRSDKEKLFKNLSTKYEEGIHWLLDWEGFDTEVRNEHFIVWMRTSTLPTFIKPYARVNPNSILPAGTYYINVTNNYPIELYGGEKWLVLSTLNAIGSQNWAYPYSYIGFGCTLYLFMFIILFSHLFFPRTLGDTSYLIADPE